MNLMILQHIQQKLTCPGTWNFKNPTVFDKKITILLSKPN